MPLRLTPFLIALFAAAVVALPLRAEESETLSQHKLKDIIARQKTLFDEADKSGEKLDSEAFRAQAQQLATEYDLLIRDSPKFAEAYADYGCLLRKVGMAKEGAAMLLKANGLNPDIPLVKNQIGNYLAESGKPLEALPYFLAAVKLEPNEPIYHYDLGLLLYAARGQFIDSGEWTRESIDKASHEAFGKAAELAPERVEFALRYAQSFADMQKPDWDGALKAWTALEAKTQSPKDVQDIRLAEVNVLIRQGKIDRAREVLATVTDDDLSGQKQKLVAQLPPERAK